MIHNIVQRLLGGVRKWKPNPIFPYVFHLYYHVETLKLEEKKVYKIGEAMVKHNIDPDSKLVLAKEEDFEQESLSMEEIATLEAFNKSSTSSLKHTPCEERKSPTVKNHQEQARPFQDLAIDDSF